MDEQIRERLEAKLGLGFPTVQEIADQVLLELKEKAPAIAISMLGIGLLAGFTAGMIVAAGKKKGK